MLLFLNTMNSITDHHLTSRQQRGFAYEQQVRNHLAIQSSVDQAWLWARAPERILEDAGIIWDFDLQRIKRRKRWDIGENHVRDTGSDIVVKKPDSYELVQAKNFSSRKVYETDLTGFLHHMVKFAHLSGSVYSNTAFHEELLQTPPGFSRVQYIRYPYIEPTIMITGGISEKDLVLRDYQLNAVTDLKTHFETERRAVLSLICGCGKTVVAANVVKDYDVAIVLSPYCAHAEQNLRRFSDMLPDHEPMLISHSGCRDARKLSTFLEQNRRVIFSATYDSSDVVSEIMSKLPESTMFCFDEFHNLSTRDMTDRGQPMNRILTSDFRALFLSATPRVYDIENNEDAEAEAAEVFGNLKISMSLREAIEKKFVTDYRVFIPVINESGDEAKFKEELSVRDVDDALLSKALFLVKCMLYEGTRKTMVFLSLQEEVDAFYVILNRVAKEYFGVGEEFWIGRIVSETTTVERREHLKRFTDHEGFAVLLNIRVLGECLDIRQCDSVMFANVCNSKIAAVQRLCRANRINPDDPDKIAKIFLWADADHDLTKFISALKEIDPEFPSKLTVVSRKYTKATAETKAVEEKESKATTEFAISVREYIGDNAQRAISKAREYVEFYNDRKRHPVQQAKDPVERNLAQWANNYRQGIAGNYSVKERPEVNAILNEIPHWLTTRTATTIGSKIDPIRAYIREHGCVPQGKSGPVEKELATWLSRQRNPAKYDTIDQSKELDKVFTFTFHEVEYLYWRDPVEFNDFVKAQCVIKRYHEEGKPVWSETNRDPDYTFLSKIKSKMTKGKIKQKVFKSTIALFYDKAPGLLPRVEECLEAYQVY